MTVESTMEDTEVRQMKLLGRVYHIDRLGSERNPSYRLYFELEEPNGKILTLWAVAAGNFATTDPAQKSMSERLWNVRYGRKQDQYGVTRLYIMEICVAGGWCSLNGNTSDHPRYFRDSNDTSL